MEKRVHSKTNANCVVPRSHAIFVKVISFGGYGFRQTNCVWRFFSVFAVLQAFSESYRAFAQSTYLVELTTMDCVKRVRKGVRMTNYVQ